MFCSNCGSNSITEGQTFCGECGAPVQVPQKIPQQFAQPAPQQFVQPAPQQFVQPAPQQFAQSPAFPSSTAKLICKIASFVCLGLILLFTMLNIGGRENGFSTFGAFFKSSYMPVGFFWHLWFVVTIILVVFITVKQITNQFNFKHPLKLVLFTIFSMFAIGSSRGHVSITPLVINLIISIIAVVPAVIYTHFSVKDYVDENGFIDEDDIYGIHALMKIKNTKINSELIFKFLGSICCILMLFFAISLYNTPNSIASFITIIQRASSHYGKYTAEGGVWHVWFVVSLILGIIINIRAIFGRHYGAILHYVMFTLSIGAIIGISIASKGNTNVMAIVWVSIFSLLSAIFFTLVRDGNDEEVDALEAALNDPIIPDDASNPLL